MKFKNVVSCLGVVAIGAGAMFGFAACGKKPPKNLVNAKDVYATAAVSSVSYFSEGNAKSYSYLSGKENSILPFVANAETRPNGITQTEVDGLKKCIKMFDSIIEKGSVDQTTTKNDNVDEKYSKYNFKMKVTLPKANGQTGSDVFEMYYDEINIKENKEVEDEKEELETSSTLEGVMVLNGVEYPVSGERKFEKDGDESESSISFTTYSNNYQNKIEVEQSFEVEGKETEIAYEYTIFEGTKKDDSKVESLTNKDFNYVEQFKTEVEIEQENNKNEVEFEFVDSTGKNPTERTYKLEKGNTDNSFVVEVFNSATMQEDNELKIQVAVDEIGNLTFTYSNGFSEIVK